MYASFERQPTIKLFTISTNKEHPNLKMWTDTAKYWGWYYDLFITEVKSTKQFGAMIYKIELLKHVLQNMDDVDYVAIVDAYDIIINNTPEECINRIQKNNLENTLIVSKDGYDVTFIDTLLSNTFFNRSFDCKMDFNLGVVIGSVRVIREYIKRMLYVWENDNLCSNKFCSEQAHFQKLLNDYNLYKCSNNTLYIDKNHQFVHTEQSNAIYQMTISRNSRTKCPVFIHVHGNHFKYEQTMILHHYYNKVFSLPCSEECFKCNRYKGFSNFKVLRKIKIGLLLLFCTIVCILSKNIKLHAH